MEVIFKWNNASYEANLSEPIDISLPLDNENSPVAFGAPPFQAKPFRSGDFVGALESGSPVNFYNLFINPHGNGTHTESVKHIDQRGKTINQTLDKYHFIAQLISIEPSILPNGDSVIKTENLVSPIHKGVEAIIIRTLPNSKDKQSRNYTDTNPTYVDPSFIEMLNATTSIKHLLIDTPSVDREQDEGKMSAHKTFWNTKNRISLNKTITEMVYVDDTVQDGLFLLNIQIPSIECDAAPSKIVLYDIVKSEAFK